MDSTTAVSFISFLPTLLFIVYGLFIILGLYCLYLFIKLAVRGIAALDIYLDEKKNKRH